MQDQKITISLTERQAMHLRQVRESFVYCELTDTIDDLFYYALDRLADNVHAGDMAEGQDRLSKIKWLIEILMQPDIEI